MFARVGLFTFVCGLVVRMSGAAVIDFEAFDLSGGAYWMSDRR
jgi:hypothetical protein